LLRCNIFGGWDKAEVVLYFQRFHLLLDVLGTAWTCVRKSDNLAELFFQLERQWM